jgi:prevent-host-death family protein
MKVIPVAEARRRLPELLRKVAQGHAPITIGRRGRPEGVLASAGAVATLTARRPLAGRVRVVGGSDALDRGGAELRAEIEASLDRTARFLIAPGRGRR